MEGLLSTGPTPSSFHSDTLLPVDAGLNSPEIHMGGLPGQWPCPKGQGRSGGT